MKKIIIILILLLNVIGYASDYSDKAAKSITGSWNMYFNGASEPSAMDIIIEFDGKKPTGYLHVLITPNDEAKKLTGAKGIFQKGQKFPLSKIMLTDYNHGRILSFYVDMSQTKKGELFKGGQEFILKLSKENILTGTVIMKDPAYAEAHSFKVILKRFKR